jgi:hypothetical protein
MKSKRYVPVNYLPVANETYQENYDRIFRKGKGKAKGESLSEEEASVSDAFKRVIVRTNGHRKIYTNSSTAKLKDLG